MANIMAVTSGSSGALQYHNFYQFDYGRHGGINWFDWNKEYNFQQRNTSFGSSLKPLLFITISYNINDLNNNNQLNHKNYNFLASDCFKNVLFSTNSLAKLLSDSLLLDSLLLDSLLSDSLISQSHSKMQFKSTNHIQSCNYVCVRARCCFCVFALDLGDVYASFSVC